MLFKKCKVVTLLSSKIKLIQSLSADQWRWVWSAYWLLWPTLLRIKYSPAGWLRQKIELSTSTERVVQTESLVANDMYDAVRFAARLHFIKADCLPKSLVLVQMLTRRHKAALLRIGVAKTAQGISSHAWVELDGKMIGEPGNVGEDFTALKKEH